MFKNEGLLERAEVTATWIVNNNATIRLAAKKFSTSKSTVHKDVTERLQHVNAKLYNQVREVIDYNISQRSIRGGEATKKKFKGKK